MIIKDMKFLLLLCYLSVSFTLQAKEIEVIDTFNSSILFNDGVTYNIVSFTFASSNAIEELDTTSSLKIGITTTQNILSDIIWEYQTITPDPVNNIVQSISVQDLNHDGVQDLIIDYTDINSEFSNHIISAFFINKDGRFHELSETFVKNNYNVLDNQHIQVHSPLSLFGRPYIDDEQKSANAWTDYYEIQDLKLVNINIKYRTEFDTLHTQSKKKLSDYLSQISSYKMSDDSTINQLQLEEYFNQITELKTVLHRTEKILF
jgi:hypothetical protein